jgi:orotate phosphoribosyltransferase
MSHSEVPGMQEFQRSFLDLSLAQGVLRFGEFQLKSGRLSPYFFNAGLFHSGRSLARLGACYADAAEAAGLAYDMLFGPAYKGIVLAAAMAIALAERHGRDLPYAFNRKEAKDHGEAGTLVGAPLKGRVLIVDDVITAGTSVRESVDLIRAQGAEPAGVLVALDRQERGLGAETASAEVARLYGIEVSAIAGLDELLRYTEARPELLQHRDRLMAYRARYGSAAAA